MKGFIASVATLSLLIGLIVWNGIWVHISIADLTERTGALAISQVEEREHLSNEFYKKWEKCKHILAISVSHTEIEAIDSRLASLRAYARDKEESDFNVTLAQLREDLEFLHHSESLTIEGII